MRVLHVIPSVSTKHGGPTYAIKSFAEALKAADVEVTIATTDDDGDNRLLDVPLGERTNMNGLTSFYFRRNLLHYKVSFGLRRWLQDNVRHFDLLHIHALFSFSSVVAARAARRSKVPYIIRPLGVLNRWGIENRRALLKRLSLRLIELPILRRAAAIHYTSDAERKQANCIGAGVSERPSFVLPIPVSDRVLANDPESFLNQFPKARGRMLILFLSRLDKKKGLEILLEAFVEIRRSESNSLLVIAGDGRAEYVSLLKKFAGDLGVQDDILWTGFLDPDQKAAAYAATAVFVLPSYSENFGIAVADALAAGVPTVTTAGVALAKEILAENAGVVVSARAGEIASAVLDLLGNPAKRQQFRERAKDLARRHFSPSLIGQQLRTIYAGIIQNSAVSVKL